MHDSEELDPEKEFIDRILAVFVRKETMSFDHVVRQYRQIEAEFVERAGDDEVTVLDRKRSITNHLLMDAENTKQPHEVCRDIWEELLERGFWDVTMRYTMSSFYARCCQNNGEFDAGIAVLQLRMTELKELLEDPALTPDNRAFCEEFMRMHQKSVDELKAGIRERLMPRSGKWAIEEIAVTRRINAVQFRERKNELSFEEAVREYRQIEAELVACAGDNETQVMETKRRITEALLDSAYKTRQLHEVCRGIWDELIQRGFTNLERRHTMSRLYVRCCRLNGEIEAGLAVIEALIRELEVRLEDSTLTKEELHFREMTLDTHKRLRDRLNAGIRG